MNEEIRPVSGKAHNEFGHNGMFPAEIMKIVTMIGDLDLHEELEKWALRTNLNSSRELNIFETNIRYQDGMLAAADSACENNRSTCDEFKTKVVDAFETLIWAGSPGTFVGPYTPYKQPHTTGQRNIAESLTLYHYTFLATKWKDDPVWNYRALKPTDIWATYKLAYDSITKLLLAHADTHNRETPVTVENVELIHGAPISVSGATTVGAGVDSAFETTLWTAILAEKYLSATASAEAYWARKMYTTWRDMFISTLNATTQRCGTEYAWVSPSSYGIGDTFNSIDGYVATHAIKMIEAENLKCLGLTEDERMSSEDATFLHKTAKGIIETILKIWQTHLGGESYTIICSDEGEIIVHLNPTWKIRPEFLESVHTAYFSSDVTFEERKRLHESVKSYSLKFFRQTSSPYGFASLRNDNKIDNCPSYAYSEHLPYLVRILNNPPKKVSHPLINPCKTMFTTEGHMFQL